MLRFKSLLFLAALTFTSTAFSAVLVEPKYRWKKSNIKICFLESKASIGKKLPAKKSYAADLFVGPSNDSNWHSYGQATRAFINTHFTKSRTGVRFSGLLPCSLVKNPDAYVIFFKSADLKPSMSTVGTDHKSRSVMIINVSTFSTPRFYATLLHEFTHLAGLFHEHERTEHLSQGECLAHPLTENTESSEGPCLSRSTPLPGAVLFTPYDKNSVMNYCRYWQMSNNVVAIQHSRYDRAALLHLFKGLPE